MPGTYKEIDSNVNESQMAPVSSRGLTQNDRNRFFMKTAAADVFKRDFENLKLADGEVPIHLSAIGADDWYGGNRKGDTFTESVLKEYGKGYLRPKEAGVYIHHWNKDPKKRYGVIKAAHYNEPMHRLELLIIANTNKKAAEKNAGLVLPDEFLEPLMKTGEAAFSMACYVKSDKCAHCGNESFAPPIGYCDENNCINEKTGEYGLGCKHNLGKTAENGEMQKVFNIEPDFVDISFVGVPADRGGYGFKADYIKSASFEPSWPEVPKSAELELSLMKLAAADRGATAEGLVQRSGIDDGIGEKLAHLEWGQKLAAFAALASRGHLLSPSAFFKAAGYDSIDAGRLDGAWRGVFHRLQNGSLASVWYKGMKEAHLYPSTESLLKGVVPIVGFTSKQIRDAALKSGGIVDSPNIAESRSLANLYGSYVGSALSLMPKKFVETTMPKIGIC